MFTPTKEELEELINLGFSYDSLFVSHGIEYIVDDFKIKYWYSGKTWQMGKYNSIQIYPTSRQDIETIIRMFNPNQL